MHQLSINVQILTILHEVSPVPLTPAGKVSLVIYGQSAAAIKRIRADAGHRRRDLHTGKPAAAIKRPRADAGHTSRNYQVAVHQLPIDVQILTIIHKAITTLKTLAPAGKFSLVIYGKPAAVSKRSKADAGHTSRNLHAGQPTAALKRRSADADHTSRNLHAGQPTAAFKRRSADASEAGGLGQVQANLGRCSCCGKLVFQGSDGRRGNFTSNNYPVFSASTRQI